MHESEARVSLGYISGVHGLKGWVKVFSYTDPREAIGDYNQWWLSGRPEPFDVLDARRHGKTVIALLEGVSTVEQATALVEQEITVPRSALPPARGEQYYWVDLLGLEVKTTGGLSLGRVDKMIETGANDVMVVRGDRERLVPFVFGQYVKQVDVPGGTIEVDWDPDF